MVYFYKEKRCNAPLCYDKSIFFLFKISQRNFFLIWFFFDCYNNWDKNIFVQFIFANDLYTILCMRKLYFFMSNSLRIASFMCTSHIPHIIPFTLTLCCHIILFFLPFDKLVCSNSHDNSNRSYIQEKKQPLPAVTGRGI